MKRLFVLTAAMAMMFASCKKYEVSKPLDLESLPKVKLTGSVYAQLDETKPSGTFDLVPKNKLMVRVSIPYNAYDVNNNSGGYYVKDATITADGAYEVEVPYISKGVTATVSFMDFTYDVKTQNSLGEVRTILKHFTRVDQVVNSLGSGKTEGDRIYINATYPTASVTTEPNSNVLEPTHKVKVSGKLEYYAADVDTGALYRKVPDTKIIATITLTAPDSRTYKIVLPVTVSNGIYAIDVPMVTRGTATVALSGEDYWEFTELDGTTKAMYRHTLTASFTAYDYRDGTQEKDYQYEKGTTKL